MLVQRINSSVNFRGAKEIDAIAQKYARNSKDMELARLAKVAEDADHEITGDGDYSIPEERAKVDAFRTAILESKNSKLAFHLLSDFRNVPGNFYMSTTYAHSMMKDIAQNSKSITRQEILDHLA